MSILDFLNQVFGQPSNLPIQVGDDLELFVEEKRAPQQSLSGRDAFGLPNVDFGGDSIVSED